MAFALKFNRVGFCSLSQACFLLGLLDLTAHSYFFIMMLEISRKTPSLVPKFLIILAGIGSWSCIFMMLGSLQEKRRSVRFHIGSEMFIMAVYTITSLILLSFYYFLGDQRINIIKIVIFLSCAPIFSFFYWNVLYNRYLEIKKRQLALSHHSATCSCTKRTKCRHNLQKRVCFK